MSEKPRLIIFDGNALIHRAYHALPPLTISKTGEMVNAVYGFVSMFLKAMEQMKPTHVAVAFDYPGPTFRHREFEEYKAQRPSTPDELIPQFARVREFLDAFGAPVFELKGYEADDIVGTLARQAQEMRMDAIVVTGDTDAMQLVGPGVMLLTSRKGFADTVLYDEGLVRERYGLSPSQIADLKGLAGDPSDNIPGIMGVGEKTAVMLLQRYGDVEGIYEHIGEIEKPRLQRLLRENEAVARQGKYLATIVRDSPVRLDLSACQLHGYDRSKLAELFRQWEFRTLLGKLPKLETRVKENPEAGPQLSFLSDEVRSSLMPEAMAPQVHIGADYQRDYGIVDDAEAFQGLLVRLAAASFWVVDVETTHKDPLRADLVGLSFSLTPGQAYYVPVNSQLSLPYVVEGIKPLLADGRIAKVVHNGKYDINALSRYGIEWGNLAFDTMIAAHLLNEKNLSLKDLAFSRLGIEMIPITELIGTGAKQRNMAEVSVHLVTQYSCADADMTGRLRGMFESELSERGLRSLFTDVEMPLVPVLAKMERNGVALDTGVLRDMSLDFGKQLAQLERKIYEAVGHQFNINSSPQLSAVLFKELRLPKEKKTKTGYSTDAAVLEDLRGTHPVIELLIEYRQLAKLKSTYVDALPALINPQTGRVHTSFNQAVTATGRLSSSDPNLQNIPIRTELGRAVRRAFVAGNGQEEQGWRLLSADYSQIDLRVLAHISQDPNLLAAFEAGEDIHRSTASTVFGAPPGEVTADMRRIAKVINFGVIYGISDYGLSQSTALSRQEAAQFIQTYLKKYSRVREYVEDTKRQARTLGYVQTLLGRRRYIPEIDSPNAQIRGAAERMAINMPIQGTAADIIKLAMIAIHQEMASRGWKSRMGLQVHDDLIFEVPGDEMESMIALVREKMEGAFPMSVPLVVDVKSGFRWGDMEG